ncbi:MAG: hypothetical protein Q9186_002276 [Xanthomendoza sp. 1 TL-2023]
MWPPGREPSKVRNFETEARRLRYQALGKACHEENFPNLLIGHHDADVKETMIMRLVEGYRGVGLRGIAAEADIANCQGLYGAYQSGGRNYFTTQNEPAKALLWERKPELLPPTNEYRNPGFEFGGVRVYRPLLKFSKAMLQDALVKAGVPWVEDPTNHARTYSIRNAIRYLLQADLLPKALSGGPASDGYNLMIAAGKIDRKFTHRVEYAEELFQACSILSFDSRTGSLEVRVPMFTESGAFFWSRSRERWTDEREHVGARLIRLLLLMVTPQDHVSLQSLSVATKAMFFDFTYTKDFAPPNQRRQHPAPAVFTAGGVYCERVDSPTGELHSESNQPYMLDPEYTWRLSRQPYVRTSPRPECIVVPTPFSNQEPTIKKDSEVTYSEPPWQLWDGRYWIQIFNPTGKVLKIFPLISDRLFKLRSKLVDDYGKPTARCNQLQEALTAAAPGSSRYILPAIIDEEGKILVLPTLNFEVEESALQWRIRYRRVTFPAKIRKDAVIGLPEKELRGLKAASKPLDHERKIPEWQEAKAEEKAKNNREKEDERMRLEEETAEKRKRTEEESMRLEEKKAKLQKDLREEHYRNLEKNQESRQEHERLKEPKSLDVAKITRQHKSLEAQKRPKVKTTMTPKREETAEPPPKKKWQLKMEKRVRKKKGVEEYWKQPENEKMEEIDRTRQGGATTPATFDIDLARTQIPGHEWRSRIRKVGNEGNGLRPKLVGSSTEDKVDLARKGKSVKGPRGKGGVGGRTRK